MKKILTITLLFFFLIGMSFFAGCHKKNLPYQALNTPCKVVDKSGNQRHYHLYLPALKKKKPVPLLVYFHGVRSECFKKNPYLKGYTGSPVEETGLIEFCKVNKIALLVPEPAYQYTFLNCPAKGWKPFSKEINGIEKLIDTVVDKYHISRKEIYLAGISAGAALSHHLANRRPQYYNAILSHSQAYLTEGKDNRLLKPQEKGPQFGVVFGYTKGDYKEIIRYCIKSEKIYRKNGYKTILLKDLPPLSHKWSNKSNRRFWRYLKKLGRYQSSPSPKK
jgi:hypothetical protein